MPVLSGDIRMMSSERLTDNEDGGGRITGEIITDGASNNLFPDVSDLDRVYGRVNLRKSFLSVATDDTDLYYGSHIILTERPADPKIGVTLFSTDSATDERDDAQIRLESYVVRGPESEYILMGDQLTGQRMITCYGHKSSPAPEVGDVYVLSVEAAGSVSQYQYVRLTAVDYTDRVFNHDTHGEYTRRVFTLEISDALRETYRGSEATYLTSNHNSPTRLRRTQVADASRYYGIAQLDEPISVGDLSFKTDTIYSQLVPSATTETSITDVKTSGENEVFIPTQSTAYNGSISMSSGKNVLNLSTAFMPGTLNIYGIYTDTQEGELLYNGANAGNVDHKTGTITVNSSVISGGPSITYIPAAVISVVAHSLAEKITLANRGFNYVNNLQPLPAPGTLAIDYMAAGRWYRLQDNGSGELSDGAGGSGTVNSQTGSTVITLGALPDTNSSLIYSWGSAVHFQQHSGSVDVTPSEFRYTIPEGELQRGTVTISWPVNGSTVTVTDNGKGELHGDCEGEVDYTTGEVRFRPLVLPDAGAVITLDFDYAERGEQSHTYSFAVSSENDLVFTLPDLPLKPGTVSIMLTDDFIDHPWKNGGQPFAHSVSAIDDAEGNISGGTTRMQFTGTVDYITGQIALVVTRWADYAWDGSSWHRTPATSFGGIVHVRYTDDATTLTPLPGSQTFNAGDIILDLTPDTINATIPGSVDFTWSGARFKDRDGSVYRVSDELTVGTIDYNTGIATLQTYSAGNNSVSINSLLTTYGEWHTQRLFFRTPGAPLRPASLYIRATALDGSLITATSNANGEIIGDGVSGSVIYDTGIVDVQFDQPVFPNTARFNCVVYSTLPLDADILGLDPVRLPVDGRVPIFRDGNVVVIHHTGTTTLPGSLNAGQALQLDAIRITEATVADADGTAVPEAFYTLDLTAGTIELANPLDLSAYTQPLTVEHRIEDMVLITDVQINGQIQAVNQISHDYPAGALVSSALIVGDVQARVANVYDQQTWTGAWSDNLIGDETSAEFNDTTYPITVTNRGAITERWALVFTGTTSFKVVGESVGEIAIGDTSNPLNPINPNTHVPYFQLNPLGFGNGWAAGRVLRFNTVGASHPMWLARTTLQGAAQGDSDSFRIQIRGNANA